MPQVNLSKTPIVNLTKGQVVNLTKDGTSKTSDLTNVFFGAKWGQIQHKGFLGFGKSYESVDLDATLILYDSSYSVIDTVYYGHKTSRCGAIHHSGDDLTGTSGSELENDNETISINLKDVNPRAKYIVAILNSYRHHKFDEIPYMKLRIYTGRAGNPDEVLCAYNIDNDESFKNKEAVVLGFFYKDASEGWKFRADGTTTNERGIDEIRSGSAKTVIRNSNV